MPKTADTQYSAKSIQALEGLQALENDLECTSEMLLKEDSTTWYTKSWTIV